MHDIFSLKIRNCNIGNKLWLTKFDKRPFHHKKMRFFPINSWRSKKLLNSVYQLAQSFLGEFLSHALNCLHYWFFFGISSIPQDGVLGSDLQVSDKGFQRFRLLCKNIRQFYRRPGVFFLEVGSEWLKCS